jgi:DNA-directed RNA polymerase subunit RPC12/RpoP
MTDNEKMIRFRCPQCTRVWKVETQHAGKKFRCPACFKERIIPDAKTREPEVALPYGVHHLLSDAQEIVKSQSLISFRCRVCRTNIAVPADQAGKISVCPDCDTENVVPEENAPGRTAERTISTGEPIEIYGFADGQNAESPKTSDDMFTLRCPICHALLYARDDQIGTSIKCPDCYRDVPVRGRPEKPVRETFQAKVYEGSSTYQLQSESRLPPDTRLVPVICSLCYTRMYATMDQIGREKECPDCGKMNRVSAVCEEDVKTVGEIFPPVGEYGVAEVTPNPIMRVNVDYRTVEDAIVRRQPSPTDETGVDFSNLDPTEMAEKIRENKEKRKKKKRKKQDGEFEEDDALMQAEKIESRAKKNDARMIYARPKLPKRPLTQGFWKIFKYGSFYLRLSISLFFFLFAAPVVATLLTQNSIVSQILKNGDRMGMGVVIMFLFLYVFAWILLLCGSAYHAQTCLAVTTSTANGGDEVDDWGGFAPLTALLSLMIIAGAFLVGWTPAILWNAVLAVLKSEESVPEYLFLICTGLTFFLFPLSLMRILEGFEQNIFKSAVLWSLWLTPFSWLRFYLLSTLCYILPAFLFAVMFLEKAPTIVNAASFGLAFCLPFFSLCYFRLFGRLGWTIEETIRKKIAELEEQAAETDDEEENELGLLP